MLPEGPFMRAKVMAVILALAISGCAGYSVRVGGNYSNNGQEIGGYVEIDPSFRKAKK